MEGLWAGLRKGGLSLCFFDFFSNDSPGRHQPLPALGTWPLVAFGHFRDVCVNMLHTGLILGIQDLDLLPQGRKGHSRLFLWPVPPASPGTSVVCAGVPCLPNGGGDLPGCWSSSRSSVDFCCLAP